MFSPIVMIPLIRDGSVTDPPENLHWYILVTDLWNWTLYNNLLKHCSQFSSRHLCQNSYYDEELEHYLIDFLFEKTVTDPWTNRGRSVIWRTFDTDGIPYSTEFSCCYTGQLHVPHDRCQQVLWLTIVLIKTLYMDKTWTICYTNLLLMSDWIKF